MATYAYNNLGQRTLLTRGNAATTAYAYDGARRLSGLTNNASGTSYDQTYGFSYNAAGQIVGRTATNDQYAWPANPAGADYYTTNLRDQYSAVNADAIGYDRRAISPPTEPSSNGGGVLSEMRIG